VGSGVEPRIALNMRSGASVRPQLVVRDLEVGLTLDSQLTMADYVTTVCRAGYYQLRQLGHIILSLTPTVAQTFVQAFITCRLDYCNSCSRNCRQSTKATKVRPSNAAARRLITGTWRTERITPVL